MKEVVRVAAVQMDVAWLEPAANLQKVRNFISSIAAHGTADLIVFPELANSGYLIPPDQDGFLSFAQHYLKCAEPVPGQFTEAVGELARKYNVHVVLGLLESHPSVSATMYNSAVLIGPSGKVIGVHRKVHIPRDEKHYFYPGTGIEVFRTELGAISMLICADNVYPESARTATLKGAEVICVPYARRKALAKDPDMYDRVASCRAYENENFLIACNRVGAERSTVFEGRTVICGPKGDYLARTDSDEEMVLTADLVAADMTSMRLAFPRFRDRRPDQYGVISQPL